MIPLYEQLANEMATSIRNNLYKSGERLPGVRKLAHLRSVSLATALAAYRLLEDRGYIEARDRSGFYVRPLLIEPAPEPSEPEATARPEIVTGQQLVLNMLRAASRLGAVQLGAAVPDASFLPVNLIQQVSGQINRQFAQDNIGYQFPPGDAGLRRQIARRMSQFGCPTHIDQVVITNGCQEALMLALKTVTRPGDLVAVESPTYYGLLQVLESLGLQAVEIPSNPRHGISLEALQLAAARWPIKACVVVPNHSNPMGFCMDEQHKRALVRFLHAVEIPLIEDDIYGDLGFGKQRPGSCKGLVKGADNIYYCSSLSKSLAPGLRIGWIVPPDSSRQQIEYQKYVMNLGGNSLAQRTAARILESGSYDRHLRKMTHELALAVERMTRAVSEQFPPGIRVSRPEGGFVLWIELPKGTDTTQLARDALLQGISIAPGNVFSASNRFGHCLRLSCACRWTPEVERAIERLGQMVREQLIRTHLAVPSLPPAGQAGS